MIGAPSSSCCTYVLLHSRSSACCSLLRFPLAVGHSVFRSPPPVHFYRLYSVTTSVALHVCMHAPVGMTQSMMHQRVGNSSTGHSAVSSTNASCGIGRPCTGPTLQAPAWHPQGSSASADDCAGAGCGLVAPPHIPPVHNFPNLHPGGGKRDGEP